MTKPAATATYTDAVFRVQDIEQAKRIILTTERGLDTETRWQTETPYLLQQMLALLPDGASQLVDFGCGIGRLSKAWLDARPQSTVLGIDISQEMRQLAPGYVQSDRFAACAPAMFDALLARHWQCDAAIACWIIQHCFDAEKEIARLKAAIKPGGRLFVVNNVTRAVPTDQGWINDGFDVAASLQRHFKPLALGRLPVEFSSEHIAANTFLGVYARE